MNRVLNDLQPSLVFKYFEEISQIPRGSKNEKGISDYLRNFGESLGLETIQDESLNIIIRKPATPGYENAPGVVLQGHMDMVCEKNKSTNHDFMKDPIKLRIDGDYVYATDTTLGADNGIAVAMGLAILASNDIAHPALELLVTVDEEAGMTGAMALDGSLVKGKYILNLDSEEEGYLLVSCAGGVTALSTLPVEFVKPEANKKAYLLEIKGLLGGHSGMDIIKQRGNANKILGRLLNLLNVDFDIAKVEGGSKNNAIPREADCVIMVNNDQIDAFTTQLKDITNIFKHELRTSDPGLEIACSETATPELILNSASKDKVIKMLNLIPNGIQTMSMDIENLVESSTNLGVLRTTDSTVTFECAVRSSVKSLKEDITARMELLVTELGGNLELISDYPAWEYAKDSNLEKVCIEAYKNLTGKEPIIMALHAGLECGLLLDKIPNAEAISFGPNMYDVHTPNEHLSISSTENTWKYLLEVLKSIK
ncbi:MAG: aminoacyl-histidine dipeptidase [Paeniclostridium sordellii]|uniref:Aminoacyl-histidine dipeptidase n=1 Tax=Paeniclostridium hominis TaxID=2764329 RepID=A0ABR7K5W5_9FIRM|nr:MULTISPECIES: aminoacyl-histidine dipeptidase [Paeniclostridium]MBC6004310.1 aminoacyl-histidine dipeptidase [Paeniclostridium hominis]MDU2591203.1 aminoacyl-histidine dipeptidase [Paeniclostridium sordellii]